MTIEPYLLPPAPLGSLSDYEAWGGGQALAIARRLGRTGVIEEVTAAGIRGRGGAGFPVGTKWGSIASSPPDAGDRFVVANGAEGEPATFKDRLLMRRNPYQVLEGLLLAALAVEAREAYVAVKGSFEAEAAALTRALGEMGDAGWVPVPVRLVTGPDEYLFGEEKGLLEVIEGEDPLPRHLPPYLYGLYTSSPNVGWSANLDRSSSGPVIPSANPTLVNNVESLAATVVAVRRGADWYRRSGTAESPGHLLVTICGDTVRGGVAEMAMGATLAEAVDAIGGGLPPGRQVKAILSGVANPLLDGSALDTPLTYEGFEAAGSGLGAAGFCIYDDTTDVVAVAHAAAWFLHVESCAQCPPCKLGTAAFAQSLDAIRASNAASSDVDLVRRYLRTVTDGARCFLATESRDLVASVLERFSDEVVGHLEGQLPPAQLLAVPKIVDIEADGTVRYDTRQAAKRPDWTYGDTAPTLSVS